MALEDVFIIIIVIINNNNNKTSPGSRPFCGFVLFIF